MPVVKPDLRTAAIEALFGARGAPLAAYAGEMVAAADAVGIDWRLIPAIAILESGGGVQACGNNAYGYASCAVDFGSPGEAIAVVAATLAGYGVDAGTAMCIWVGGSRCTTAHEIDYRAKGERLFATLDSLL